MKTAAEKFITSVSKVFAFKCCNQLLWAFPFGSGYSLQWLVRTSQTISAAIPNAGLCSVPLAEK
jgi:hypothetical protein